MMKYLVDTNIISELAKKEPNPGIVQWASSVKQCSISAITIEELYYGLAWRPNLRVQQWLDVFIDNYAQVIPITNIIAQRAGFLRGQFQSRGIVRTQADMLIAASSLEYGLTLVTRNVRDFDGCGIALLDPFQC